MYGQKMSDVVFFIWQSDSAATANRNFIRDCIRKAIQHLNSKGYDLEYHEATSSAAGSPEITRFVLEQIELASAVIADVTPVASTDNGKPIANPNVMFELGWAYKSIGERRISLLTNTAGASNHEELRPEDAAFDIRHRRLSPYTRHHPKGPEDTSSGELTALLTEAIRMSVDESRLRPTTASLSLLKQVQRANNNDRSLIWTDMGVDFISLGQEQGHETLQAVGVHFLKYGDLKAPWRGSSLQVSYAILDQLLIALNPTSSNDQIQQSLTRVHRILNALDLVVARNADQRLAVDLPASNVVPSTKIAATLLDLSPSYLEAAREHFASPQIIAETEVALSAAEEDPTSEQAVKVLLKSLHSLRQNLSQENPSKALDRSLAG